MVREVRFSPSAFPWRKSRTETAEAPARSDGLGRPPDGPPPEQRGVGAKDGRAAPSTYFHRRVTHPTALRVLQARSVVRRDAGPSQGPRGESARARKAARRVAFRGRRRALAPLDDVQTSPASRSRTEGRPARLLHPGGREKRSYVASYESKY